MQTDARKATFLASLGAGLEYYDFIIYGMMAGYLSRLFFSDQTAWLALAKTYAIFAVGYLTRPLGGILFGMVGDSLGRKKAFLAVMFLMAFSTFGIGLLPSYSQAGNVGVVLLLILRLLQGISFGAELPGAITLVYEYSEREKKSLFSGWIISSVSMGSLLASLAMYLLSKSFSGEEVLNGAWRIPFLLGGILAIVNFFVRKHLQETLPFLDTQPTTRVIKLKEPLMTLLKHYPIEIGLGIGLTLFAAALVIAFLYLPICLSAIFSSSELYLSMTLGMIWSAIFLPVSGWLTDRFGQYKVFLFTCVAFSGLAFPLFALLSLKSIVALICFMLIYQTILSFLSSSYLVLLSDLFHTRVRYTGIGLCYNAAYSLMSCLPLLWSFFRGMTGDIKETLLIALVLILLALLSASSGLLLYYRTIRERTLSLH